MGTGIASAIIVPSKANQMAHDLGGWAGIREVPVI